MPIFNYVREHRRFIRYASDNKLTSSERLLWYALVEIINEESESNVWPDEFIRISNNRVLMLCDPMGIDTMVRARNGLKQRGLIEFKPGNKNKENPAYRVKLFYPDGYTQNADKTGFYTQNAYNMGGNIQGNIGGNVQGNTGGNMPGSMGNIYINQNRDYTETQKGIEKDDGDAGDFFARAEDPIPDRSERENVIRAAYLRCFGWQPNRAEVDALVVTGSINGFMPEMVARALEIAAEEGARKPVQYVRAILNEWKREDVMQPHQIDQYRFMQDIRAGRHDMAVYGTGDAAEDFRQEKDAREARRQENADAGIGHEFPVAMEG